MVTSLLPEHQYVHTVIGSMLEKAVDCLLYLMCSVGIFMYIYLLNDTMRCESSGRPFGQASFLSLAFGLVSVCLLSLLNNVTSGECCGW